MGVSGFVTAVKNISAWGDQRRTGDYPPDRCYVHLGNSRPNHLSD